MHEELASAERAAKATQGKLDRLDEAFLVDRLAHWFGLMEALKKAV